MKNIQEEYIKQLIIPIVVLVTLCFFISLFLSVNTSVAEETNPKPKTTILRLHGSNTVGAKMAPALAIGLFKKKMGALNVNVIPGKRDELEIVADMPAGQLAIEIYSHGSSTGFRDMEAGKCDIAMASRPIKKKEVEKLAFLGDLDSPYGEHIVALDGVAVIVHPSNPLNSISITQLRDIFSGRIKRWEEITNKKTGPITVLARDDNSGTYDTFRHLVLGKIPLSPDARRFESNSNLSGTVSSTPSSIGFTGLPYILKSKALGVSDGSSAPIMPNANTIATEDYILTRRLFLYTSPFPDNVYVNFFVDFALSETGQDVAEAIGFVGQEFRVYTPNFSETAIAKAQGNEILKILMKSTTAYKRVSVNFRFKPGTTELDARGKRDILRLCSFLKKNRVLYHSVLLVGFTDSLGDYNKNYELGMQRAAFVRDQLRVFGTLIGADAKFSIESGGEELPVASNNTESGRNKNRRVEVWIK